MTTALLLSGGIDSTALAAWKRPDLCITVDYGQLAAETEISCAKNICSELSLSHDVIRVDCKGLGSGDLVGKPPLAAAPVSEWWPYRNQLLLTLAAISTAALGIQQILVGAVRSDSSHRDGTREFFDLMDSVLAYQECNLRVSAPASELSSVELVKASGIKLSLLALTHSCHTGRIACGRCRGCQKHFSILQELGLEG